VDLNLLIGLNALLLEESVTGAAKRMNLSVPAMSRMLGRIRGAVGDPILVRAGSKMVPTPRALELRGPVNAIITDAFKLLCSEKEGRTPSSLERTFTLRASDMFAGPFAARLAEIVRAVAPNVMLRFAPEGDEDLESLREARVDVELGVVGATEPEIRVQTLFWERLVGVVGAGHAVAHSEMTLKLFSELTHVSVSRRGRPRGPIDVILDRSNLLRKVALVVPNFYAALFAVAASDLTVAVPRRLAESAQSLLPIHIFALPMSIEPFPVSQAWHPRFDADPAHKWLRESVRAAIKLEFLQSTHGTPRNGAPGEDQPAPPHGLRPVRTR
jgi:DNA-binding transcriptional LysR family regulator